MFDDIPTPAAIRQLASPRPLAMRFIAKSGARLVLAASRLGGGEGAALACAFMDMILDLEVHPHHWPIDELIELFREPAERLDVQVEPMVERLEGIRRAIGRINLDHDA